MITSFSQIIITTTHIIVHVYRPTILTISHIVKHHPLTLTVLVKPFGFFLLPYPINAASMAYNSLANCSGSSFCLGAKGL
jgi:hypothetical protein